MRSKQIFKEGSGVRLIARLWLAAVTWLVGLMVINNAHAALVFPEQAIQIRSTGAVLAATITLTDGPGKAWFEYGLGTNLNLRSAEVSIPSATNLMRFRVPIGGLQAGNLVRYRAVFSNSTVTAIGHLRSFSTSARLTVWGGPDLALEKTAPQLTNVVGLAAYLYNGLALNSSGQVIAWGENGAGQTNVPDGLTDVVGIAAGGGHSVSVTAGGTVVSWGLDHAGQSSVPLGLMEAVGISAGEHHSMAVRRNGDVVGWGEENTWFTNAIRGVSNIVSVGSGKYDRFLLTGEGAILRFVQGNPIPFNLGSNFVALVPGRETPAGILSDGRLTNWLSSNGADFGQRSIPPALGTPVSFANSTHCLSVTLNGEFVGWPSNVFSAAVLPKGISNIAALACGSGISVIAGANVAPSVQPLRFSTTGGQSILVQLPAQDVNRDPFRIKIGSVPTMGNIFQVGLDGQAGDQIQPNTYITDSQNRVLYVAPSAGGSEVFDHFSYRADDGTDLSEPATVTVAVRGKAAAFSLPSVAIAAASAEVRGFAGEMGSDSRIWFELVPVAGGATRQASSFESTSGTGVKFFSSIFEGLDTNAVYSSRLVVSNSTGITRSLSQRLILAGRVVAWGAYGPDKIATNPPAPNTVGVAAVGNVAHALQADGTVVSWGSDYVGGLSMPVGATSLIQIASGYGSTVGLRRDGSVAAWSQPGYPMAADAAGITNAVSVAAGAYHGLALLRDGTVRAFGFNGYGQANVPADLSNVVQIACGHQFSAALSVDGRLVTWGNGITPTIRSNVVAISADATYLAAILNDGTLATVGSVPGGVPVGVLQSEDWIMIDAADGTVAAGTASGRITGWGGGSLWPISGPASNVFPVAFAAGATHGVVLGTNFPPVAVGGEAMLSLNEERTITLPGGDPNGDPITILIRSLPAHGQLFQVIDGMRGDLISTPSALVTDPFGRIVYRPEAGGYGTNFDTFTYAVADGSTESPPAAYRMHIAVPLAATRPTRLAPNVGIILEGSVLTRGLPTSSWFEWGTTTNYGFRLNVQPVTNLAGMSSVSGLVSNLWPGIGYHCRLVVSNESAVAYGVDEAFAWELKTTGWGRQIPPATNTPSNTDHLVALAAGSTHQVALRSDGSVRSWGFSSSGQTNVPVGLSNVSAIAAGGATSFGLLENRSTIAWGAATNVSEEMTNLVALAGWDSAILGLRADGSVVATSELSPIPTGMSNVVRIAVGPSISAALSIDGQVWWWGRNGSDLSSNWPRMSNAVKISVGGSSLAALANDGTVRHFVNNSLVDPFTNGLRFRDLVMGSDHGLVVDSAGMVTGFGGSNYDQISVPNGLPPVAGVAAGSGFSSALLPNIPPVAVPSTNRLRVDGSLAISLKGSDGNGDAVSLRVSELPSRGRLFQWDGTYQGTQVAVPNTIVADPQGRLLFLPDGLETGFPYTSFKFVANDGESDSAPATVTLEVDAATTAHTLPAWVLGPDQARLHGMFMARISSSAWIEWGVSNAFDRVSENLSISPASTNRYLEATVSNLTANTEFRFRLVVSNEAGVYRSLPESFMTGGRIAQWGSGTAAVPGGPAGFSRLAEISGFSFSYRAAIRNNGRPIVWTPGSSGLGTIPASATNVVALSGGSLHLLALRSDGTLVAWGNNAYGQGAIPNGLSNVVAIASGDAHNFALKRDGSLVVWGIGSAGANSVPAAASNVVAMVGGLNHSAVLTEEGRVVTWGTASYFANPPTRANGVFRRLASASEQVVALNSNGTMVAWGKDTFTTSLPGGFSSVGAGPNSAFGIRTNGTLVVGWGSAPSGQPSGLGAVVAAELSGNYGVALQPNRLPVVTNQFLTTAPATDVVVTLAAGDPDLDPLAYRIAQLPARGKLFQALGGGRGAQITTNDTPITDTFLLRVIYAPDAGGYGADYGAFKFSVSDGDAMASTGLVTVAVQGRALAVSQAIQADGPDSVRFSGFVSSGRLEGATWFEWGTETNYGFRTSTVTFGTNDTPFYTATTVSNLALGQTVWSRLVASNGSGVVYGQPRSVIFGSGLIGWGRNDFGQGRGPGVGASMTNFLSAAAGGGFNLGLRVDGTVHAWGADKFGLLSVPAAATGVVAVAAGTNHAVALRRDGSVLVWGSNFKGQTDIPATAIGVVAIAAGADHTLALRADRTILAWGANDYGQASAPGGETRFAGLAAGDFHSLGLRIDGSQAVWGSGSFGQAILTTGSVEVAAGSLHTINLATNGLVRQWGLLGTNVVASNALAIAAKGYNSAYRNADGTWSLWGSNRFAQLIAPESITNSPAVWLGYGHALAYGGNLAPVALATIVDGVANADLVIALKGSDANGGSLGFELLSLPATGRLFQFNNGAKGVEIVSAPANLSDSSGRFVFAPATDSYGPSNAVLSFRVSDGVSSSAAAPVVVNLSPGNQFAWTAEPGRITGTTARLRGMVGYGGVESLAWFDLVDESGSRSTPPEVIPRGKNMTSVEVQLAGLTVGQILEHRLVVSNVAGIFPGNFRRLVTAGKLRQDTGLGLVRQQTDVVAAQSGPAHVLAVLTNGTVFASGNSGNGRLDVPPGLSGIVAVAGGSTSSYALGEDGVLTGWGALPSGFPTNSSAPINLVAVAALADAVYGIDRKGVVQGFGPLPWGPYAMPAGLSNVVAIQIEPAEVRAIRLDGSVVAWGATNIGLSEIEQSVTNVAGLSGTWILRRDGTIASMIPLVSNLAVHVSTITNARAIATAGQGPVAILADGRSITLTFPSITNSTLQIAQFNASPNYPVGVTRNLSPSAMASAVTNVANSDLTVTLAGTDPENDPVSFRIVSLPAKGRLFQLSGSGRGTEIVSVPTPVTDAGKRVVFAPAADDACSPYDTFQFDTGDGVAFSAAAAVTISVTATPATIFPLPLVSVRQSGAMFNALVAPGVVSGKAWFEWGSTLDLGNSTAATTLQAGSTRVRFSAGTGPLVKGQVYSFRLVVSNSIGIVRGPKQRFIAGGKAAVWSGRTRGPADVNPGFDDLVSLAAGENHNLAIRLDGTVVGWGTNDAGQLSPPPGLADVIQVAAGGRHSLALKSDGTVVAWGANNNGQTAVPQGLTDVISIAASTSNSFTLKSDGTMIGWGTGLGTIATNVIAMGASGGAAGYVGASGQVLWIFGSANSIPTPSGAGQPLLAQLAISSYFAAYASTNTSVSTVRPAFNRTFDGTVSNVTSVAAGFQHLLAVDEVGRVFAGGANTDDQVFVGSGVSNAVMVAAAGSRSIALVPELPPFAFADVVPVPNTSPVELRLTASDPSGDALALAVVALPASGSLYQWTASGPGSVISSIPAVVSDPLGRLYFMPGANVPAAGNELLRFRANDGQLISVEAAVVVETSKRPFVSTSGTTVRGPGAFTVEGAAVPNGTPTSAWFEWGLNRYVSNRTTPASIGVGRSVVPLNAPLTGLVGGRTYFFRLMASNAVGVTAGNLQQFVNGGTAWSSTGSSVPTNWPPGEAEVAKIAAGDFMTYKLSTSLSVKSISETGPMPPQPLSATGLVSLAAGYGSVGGYSVDRTLVWTGLNGSGNLTGLAASAKSPVVSFGDYFAWHALNELGMIQPFGGYMGGPVVVPYGVTNIVSIGTGRYQANSFAVRADGTVVSWNNTTGLTNSYPEVTNAVSVAVGRDGSSRDNVILLRSDGRIMTLTGGFFGIPPEAADLTNATSVAAGGRFAAITADGRVIVWPSSGLPAAFLASEGAAAVAVGQSHVVVLIPATPVLVPRLLSSPLDVTVAYGGSTSLTAVATGTAPLSFQWMKDGLPLGGANQATLPLNFATRLSEGQYSVMVANETDSISSSLATVRVLVPQLAGTPRVMPGGRIEFEIADAIAGGLSQTNRLTVEASTELGTEAVWTSLPGPVQLLGGRLIFSDHSATNFPKRFYRVIER